MARYKSRKEQNARDKWKRVGTKETKKGKSVKINETGLKRIKNETELKKEGEGGGEKRAAGMTFRSFSSPGAKKIGRDYSIHGLKARE